MGKSHRKQYASKTIVQEVKSIQHIMKNGVLLVELQSICSEKKERIV
jgi:hypothetical protein